MRLINVKKMEGDRLTGGINPEDIREYTRALAKTPGLFKDLKSTLLSGRSTWCADEAQLGQKQLSKVVQMALSL